ncbi:hypothetical protein SAMN06265222_111121 [Neorhodopirellula lusitana]|uniref:Uncharacterized protein n=1 Tax=Neorhodopirellula lusitana TaxID=445327 RepID=A0ABY1QG45_9BACT|nr:hypothetical protein SAMN06265222_111121 [Neorhodopirellula lusitana]
MTHGWDRHLKNALAESLDAVLKCHDVVYWTREMIVLAKKHEGVRSDIASWGRFCRLWVGSF